jgi:hypothetical protein
MLNAGVGRGDPGLSGEERSIVVLRLGVDSMTNTVALDPEFIVTEFWSSPIEKVGGNTVMVIVRPCERDPAFPVIVTE